jgi:hypothetical protein
MHSVDRLQPKYRLGMGKTALSWRAANIGGAADARTKSVC